VVQAGGGTFCQRSVAGDDNDSGRFDVRVSVTVVEISYSYANCNYTSHLQQRRTLLVHARLPRLLATPQHHGDADDDDDDVLSQQPVSTGFSSSSSLVQQTICSVSVLCSIATVMLYTNACHAVYGGRAPVMGRPAGATCLSKCNLRRLQLARQCA